MRSANLITVLGIVFAAACSETTSPPMATACFVATGQVDEVWVAGGEFEMGSDEQPEERPRRKVRLDGFWMDRTEVTNAQFAAFVSATAYVTVAERQPLAADNPDVPADRLVKGSAVFSRSDRGWSYVPGADWRHPEGPGSGIRDRMHHPVVHVAYADALAYAAWLGRELPTEAQWERAARGGVEGELYIWGDEAYPDGEQRANTWQGMFPFQDEGRDGYAGTAPVGCFAANEFGLFDMAGNVWEWTQSHYDNSASSSAARTVRGGSHLCAPNFCSRFRPAARQPGDPSIGTNHIGFRTVRLENSARDTRDP